MNFSLFFLLILTRLVTSKVLIKVTIGLGALIHKSYAAARGVLRYGYFDTARRRTVELLDAMCRVYRTIEPHSIWECYSPDGREPGRQVRNDERCRKDFCGWSALAPIAMFIECVIGIHSVDAFRKVVRWDLDTESPGRTGIRGLRFGGVNASMIFEGGTVEVESDAPFALEINGREFPVAAGKRRIVPPLRAENRKLITVNLS